MSVIIFAESINHQLKKNAFEAVTFGLKTAAASGITAKVVVLGKADNIDELGNYGATEIYNDSDAAFDAFDSQVYTRALAHAFEQLGGTVFVLSHSSTGKSLAGRLAVKLQAGLVCGANAIPNQNVVSKSVFSGKAIGFYKILSERQVITVMGNAIRPEKLTGIATISSIALEKGTPGVTVIERQEASGTVPLPEATKVVSAGRGMKDPSNWGIVEELANEIGATLACSRPVADAGWRPHNEHVGQTGIAIRPNLYIALGISGAIQHLAGVNNSKTIVVINKDPEAPFFKAADYGIVGDLFEIVPKMTASIKKLKAGELH